MKVNGVKLTRVDFNTATGDLRFTVKLNEGTNTFVVTGTNTVGTDSKTTVVLFENKPTIDKPAIVYTNPARCPASFEQGAQSIKGVVSNVSSAQQVVFKIGGKEVTNALTEMKDGKLNFTIPILMGSVDLSIQTTATNSAGVEVKSCLVKPIKSTIKPATPIKTDGRNPTLNPNVVTPKDSGKVVPDQPVLVNPGRTPTVNPDNSGKGKPSRTGTVRPIP